MRILHVTSELPPTPGGAETYAVSLANQQAGQGHVVALAAKFATETAQSVHGASDDIQTFEILTSRWARHGRSSLVGRLLNQLGDLSDHKPRVSLQHVVSSWQPDIVHVHNIHRAGVGLLKALTGVPWVQTIHDHSYLDPTVRFTDRRGRPLDSLGVLRRWRMLYLRRHARSGHLVFLTSAVAERFATFGFLDSTMRSSVIPSGRAVERDMNAPDNPSDVVRFGYVGKLEHAKGVKTLIERWPAAEGSISLTIAGAGSLATDVQAFADEHQNVTYLGILHPDEVWTVMQGIECLIFPSVAAETLPLVIQEAISLGIPVIASRMSTGPHVIDGVTGIVFDRPEQLTEAIKSFATDAPLRQRLREGAKAEAIHIRKLAADHSEKLMDLYHEEIARARER